MKTNLKTYQVFYGCQYGIAMLEKRATNKRDCRKRLPKYVLRGKPIIKVKK